MQSASATRTRFPPELTSRVKAEPKTLRYRILHAAGRQSRGAGRRRLKISADWLWAGAIAAAWHRITALPQAP